MTGRKLTFWKKIVVDCVMGFIQTLSNWPDSAKEKLRRLNLTKLFNFIGLEV